MVSDSSRSNAPESELPPAPQSPVTPLADTEQRGLDRRAVERVLARAAELQGIGGGESDADAITEQRLLDIAKEAGLTITSVRQAIAEERTRVGNETDDDTRWLVRVAGATTVTASRTIMGEPEAMIAYLDSYMQRDECMRVQRRFADRVTWEPRDDWVAAIKRGLRTGGRSYQLSRAGQIAATVVPVDDTRSLVRLDADLGPSRTRVVRAGGAVGATGLLAGGTVLTGAVVAHVALAVALGVAVFPIGTAAAGAYFMLRRHHGFAERMSLALEQVLDRLEYGESRGASSFFAARPVRQLLR
ncbi:MAG: hypothetical protein M3R65_12195 [Gemmatimonadota bacterium]|nr:hypothetical protein [Gemmatimonadota bacterium]